MVWQVQAELLNPSEKVEDRLLIAKMILKVLHTYYSPRDPYFDAGFLTYHYRELDPR